MSERGFIDGLDFNKKGYRAAQVKDEHMDAVSAVLSAEDFSDFLSMDDLKLRSIITNEHTDHFPDGYEPTAEDHDVPEAYVKWVRSSFNLSIEECAEEIGVDPNKLKQLISDIPVYLQERYVDRPTQRMMGRQVVGNVIYFDFTSRNNGVENDAPAPVIDIATGEQIR